MQRRDWTPGKDAEIQLVELLAVARSIGVMVLGFPDSAVRSADEPAKGLLERWTQTRAVTVADVRGRLAQPDIEVALLCDLVYLRPGAEFALPESHQPPSSGLVWALGRAGGAALAEGLLGGGTLGAERAVEIGLAQQVLSVDEPIPLPTSAGIVALTAARDLVRSGAGGQAAEQLELATFRFVIACGEPREGARAFLEKREAQFTNRPLGVDDQII
ncbi:MAG: enoyl-CoA delta isomerase 1 [bacterium]|nr:enoyl-CoA delta isomerase 1 [bacterium]